MNKLIFLLLFILTISSCNRRINIFKTGKLDSTIILDSIDYINNGKCIVLPITIKGDSNHFLFDTGADIVLTKINQSDTNYNAQIIDSNGKIKKCKISELHDLKINKHLITGLYSFSSELPQPLLCFANGVIGNTILRSCNWLINKNKVYYSTNSFKIDDSISLNTFFYSSNRLFSNFQLNEVHIDTCLIDYGGRFDLELPLELYLKHKEKFVSNYQFQKIKTDYGINGKSNPDTVLSMNCNITFNNIPIDSVNINFKSKSEKKIGYLFLKRFSVVAINNLDNRILFSGLTRDEFKKYDMIYSFDLINGFFAVESKILNKDILQVDLGNRFIQINNKKSTDFIDYCEFLTWKDNFANYEYLDLITADNKRIKIKNWRFN